jgi:Phasin protein
LVRRERRSHISTFEANVRALTRDGAANARNDVQTQLFVAERRSVEGAECAETNDRPVTVGVLILWEVRMRKSEKAAARGAADLQAQLTEAWNEQFGRTGETYGRLFAAMRDELTGFMQRRLDANVATMQAWTECRSLNEALALQQDWVKCAVEQYVEEGNRIIETCRSCATDDAESAAPADKPAKRERSKTERKRAAHREHHAPDFREAA